MMQIMLRVFFFLQYINSYSFVIYMLLFFFFFFFQAEDGIRDWSVTGVQTCALPISYTARSASLRQPTCWPGVKRRSTRHETASWRRRANSGKSAARKRREQESERSEERRVGKECRSRWSPYH